MPPISARAVLRDLVVYHQPPSPGVEVGLPRRSPHPAFRRLVVRRIGRWRLETLPELLGELEVLIGRQVPEVEDSGGHGTEAATHGEPRYEPVEA